MKASDCIKTKCVEATVSIFGDKWTPLLVCALTDAVLRFSQLEEKTGINPRTLSERLTRLEEEGIIKKIIYSEIPPHTEYSLTPKGKDLVPILQSMADWGEKYPG